MAAQLGSDVPFCWAGEGRARVRGTGQVLELLPWDEVAGRAYTLLVPPFGVSTAAVYRAWDELGGPVSDNFNDLEPAALRVEPRLAEWRDRLGDATGHRPWLAGSGSTWFVPGEHPGQGRFVVRAVRAGAGALRLQRDRRHDNLTAAGGAGSGANAATCLPAFANVWPSASSCASSYACACGAS